MEALPVQRPGSIRSVASNSSIASGVSLSRQPRTRTRSRTVTGATETPEGAPATPSDLPYLSGLFVQEPLEDLTSSSRDPLTGPPARPPRSPQRLEVGEIRSSDTASSQGGTDPDPTFVEPLPSGPISVKPSKATKQASTLPLLDTGYRPPPSAFSRDPALTPIVNMRDSVSTQQSGISSSLYPPSTSTASLPESPTSPQSIAGQMEPPPFALEVNEVQEYDSDDVSYRLRLLVKNNYFLPPAHSKPSPADFAPLSLNVPKKSPRTGAPFLDLFRVGKSRSKPTTPTGPTSGFDPTLPMLRTTSDSISAPYALRTNQPRSSSQFPHTSPHISSPAPRGRVVVVRERMNDIAVAAKQAEQDLKARGVWIEQGSQKGNPIVVDDVIDPTDAVDIPLPSASYPFAVQTSAIHGLGVLESVGADVLADRLPPAKNPNLPASYDPVEDSWRKALLQEAVHLSLDNTPDVSTFSHVLGTSTPLTSPRSKGPDTPRVDSPPNMTTQQLIQQKIVAQPLIDVTSPVKHSRQKSNGSTSRGDTTGKLAVPPVETRDTSRPSSYQRVDTPSGPMTPLGPPPRRYFVNPLYSLSQTDLTNDYQPPHISDAPGENDSQPTLRRTVSSPLLAEGYNSSASSRHSFMTPPPVPQYSRDSQATVTSFDTVRGDETIEGVLSDSHESDHEGLPRNSLALSAMMSRPSLSEYSQESLSPTTSTFQDMINHESHSTASSTHPGPSRFSIEQQSTYRSSLSARSVAMSPPPRMSSSLAHVALPPPPRSLSFSYQTTIRTHLSSSESSPQSNHSPPAGDSTFHITAPEPTAPLLPLTEPRKQPSHSPLSVDISSTFNTVPVRMDSAPGPSSPTSFFDSIQSQPNAMDDLESSSDESDDDEPNPIPPKLFVDPRTRAISNTPVVNPRPQIMKHGNFSTPYIRPGEFYRQNLLPIGNYAHSKQPISSNPIRVSKNDPLPSSSYDFFQYAQENPPNFSDLPVETSLFRRPSTGEHVMTWRNNQRAQDSLRKLDGMLLQHMEDEKDTIKRIATHMKQTTNSQPSDLPPR